MKGRLDASILDIAAVLVAAVKTLECAVAARLTSHTGAIRAAKHVWWTPIDKTYIY